MGHRLFKPKQIIHMLRESEVTLARGQDHGGGVRGGISEQSWYRWRKAYGGMQVCRPSGSRNSSARMRG